MRLQLRQTYLISNPQPVLFFDAIQTVHGHTWSHSARVTHGGSQLPDATAQYLGHETAVVSHVASKPVAVGTNVMDSERSLTAACCSA